MEMSESMCTVPWTFLRALERVTYHIRVKWRGYLLGIEVVPVDWREKYVVLDFNLGNSHVYMNKTCLLALKNTHNVINCWSGDLQSPLCSPVSWFGPFVAVPPAGVWLRWKCWVWAAEVCSECCRTSPLCYGCRTEAADGRENTLDDKHENVHALSNAAFYLPGHTASRTGPLLSTTSLLSGHTAACVAPQEPNTGKK